MQISNLWLFITVPSMGVDWQGCVYLPLFSECPFCGFDGGILYEADCGDKAEVEACNVCVCCFCGCIICYVLSGAYRYAGQE